MKTKSEKDAENLASKTAEALRFIVERHAKFDYEKQKEFNLKFKLNLKKILQLVRPWNLTLGKILKRLKK